MFDRNHIAEPTPPTPRQAQPTFVPIHVKRCLECRRPLAGSGGRDVYCAKCRAAVTDALTWGDVSPGLL